jgi:glycine/D-amino acid oxidase-like deaminating enzyme
MGKTPDADVLVVGAGIFGLACARACLARGLSVVVADRDNPGAAASGGLVGALSPHPPERWNRKKAFQRDALQTAEAWWQAVANEGSTDPGFRRCGRLIPLATPAARDLALARAEGALRHWPEARWTLVAPDHLPDWLDPAAAPFGAVWETLSARLHPRRAVAALAAAVTARGCTIRTGWQAEEVAGACVRFDRGTLTARTVVLAAGTGAFPLIAGLTGRALGQGVKGQAALLAADASDRPMIYTDGLYVVPHGDGTVAVGSTSETAFADPDATDARLDALIDRARRVSPALRAAPVLERWAGLRPRAPRPDPMLGPLPGHPHVLAATGGFKTGFGLAPAVGAAIAAMVAGQTPPLPPGFTIAEHLAQVAATS